jgi:hypothetical protein
VAEPTELRLALLATGVEPLPSTPSKEVFLKDWRARPIDETEIRSWEPHLLDWPNTSARTTDNPCLDLDIRDEDVAEAAELLVRDWFDGRGEILCRIGQPPKRLIPFRTSTPFAKRLLVYADPAGHQHRIEFLGDGQQAVFFGFNESAKRFYNWHAIVIH